MKGGTGDGKRVLIGGVGNVLLGDDGAGPFAVRLLESQYEFGPRVTITDLGTPGLDLIAHLTGIDALILVDSAVNGAVPGAVTLYRRDEIMRAAQPGVRIDPHSPALGESLMIADFTGESASEILLVGITGESYEPDRPLSTAARGGAERAILEVLRELERLEIPYRAKASATAADVWWEPGERSTCGKM